MPETHPTATPNAPLFMGATVGASVAGSDPPAHALSLSRRLTSHSPLAACPDIPGAHTRRHL